jgi:predicted amidohydrolase
MGQLLVEGGEPERNLGRAVEMIQEAAEANCDIVLLPECLDLGWTHPSARTEAVSLPGIYSDLLCQCARDCHIYVCAGLTENHSNTVYNAAVLINSDGSIILHYRKINVLECAFDYYAIGTSLSVVETPFGVMGVNICSDNYIDSLEIGHTLARMGAQLILSPSSWTIDHDAVEGDDPYGEKWLKPYRTLADVHNIVLVSATSVGYIVGGPYEGKKMVGYSLAVSEEGIIARGQYNEFTGQLIVAEIEIPRSGKKGTAIGRSLQDKGFYN